MLTAQVHCRHGNSPNNIIRKETYKQKLHMIPVTIVFHDDNYGVTTALWETYYRYYYKDGRYGGKDTAGIPTTYPQRAFAREAYEGAKFIKHNLVWIYNIPIANFLQVYKFKMARKTYTCYTLVNPANTTMATYDTLNNCESGLTSANQMVIEYETVLCPKRKSLCRMEHPRLWKGTL